MLTTGGLLIIFDSSSSFNKSSIFQSNISLALIQLDLSLINFTEKLSAIIQAESKSILLLILTSIQFFINSAISFEKGTHIFSDNSFKVRISQIITSSQEREVRFCSISSTFLSSFFFQINLFDLEKVISFSESSSKKLYHFLNQFFFHNCFFFQNHSSSFQNSFHLAFLFGQYLNLASQKLNILSLS
jgi:hypothetical protein